MVGGAVEGDGARGRNVVPVEHKGMRFLVGPDVVSELGDSDIGRDISPTYHTSVEYGALMRGALAMIGEPEIDVLSIGLPMDRFDNRQLVDAVRDDYTGTIDLGFGRSVKVRRCVVRPQPFGGYFGLVHHLKDIDATLQQYPQLGLRVTSEEELHELTTLVVDPGTYTLDWIVFEAGKVLRTISGAANSAGRYRALQRLRAAIAAEVGQPLVEQYIADIDRAELTGKPLRIYGRAFDLREERFQAIIRQSVRDAVQQMIPSLRLNIGRVNLIAVVGGSTRHVADALREMFPTVPVYAVPENGTPPSIYTNLIGFQRFGEAVASA
jgi:plasmid segregation protein ParM